MSAQKSNKLIEESSPYLLQHAHNPVNWRAWNKETLELAKSENKPILVSIGYSTCHWCHVMERECFEREDVAEVMNRNFICIKVDREEHPDVDSYYMSALQSMTGSGGWPLNIIALSDARPVWGVTYLPANRWMSSLEQVANIIKNDYKKAEDVAIALNKKISSSSTLIAQQGVKTGLSEIENSLKQLKNYLDFNSGGYNRAPKFPQANNYRFLMQYLYVQPDDELDSFLRTTLDKISMGGIYDWVGGGFSRYSVDDIWKVPHFEKMLYDNSQLMSLYAQAYTRFKDSHYADVVSGIHRFVKSEMTTDQGAFYSAMDADSQGVEGKYYIWQSSELKSLLKGDYELFAAFFNVVEGGNWEHGASVLHSVVRKEEFCSDNSLSLSYLESMLQRCLGILEEARKQRIAPAKDDKIIISQNALMAKAYFEAYKATSNTEYLDFAIKNIEFILSNAFYGDNAMFHTIQKGRGKIAAYLDDYAFLIDALILGFAISGTEVYYQKAKQLCDFVLDKFFDNKVGMFRFTGPEHDDFISVNYEVEDNVIPSSNSQMAQNMFLLSRIEHNSDYEQIIGRMMDLMSRKFLSYPLGYSNWGILQLWQHSFSEIVLCGDQTGALQSGIYQHYLPFSLVLTNAAPSELEIFRGRFVEGSNLIYHCVDRSCKMPVKSVVDLGL